MKIKAALVATAMLLACSLTAANAETHEVLMLNKGEAGRNIFEPAMLKIEPGDTVKFIATDRGHNTQSIDGMAPEGGSAWQGKVNEEMEIVFDVEGVYGYMCRPHYGLGMVGLIIVGDGLDNRDDAADVGHPGKARAAFADLFERL